MSRNLHPRLFEPAASLPLLILFASALTLDPASRRFPVTIRRRRENRQRMGYSVRSPAHLRLGWIQGGGDLYRLSRVPGRSTRQVTARYGHLRTDDLHEELERVAQSRSERREISEPNASLGAIGPTPD